MSARFGRTLCSAVVILVAIGLSHATRAATAATAVIKPVKHDFRVQLIDQNPSPATQSADRGVSFGNASIWIAPASVLDSSDVLDAHVDFNVSGEPAVAVLLTSKGASRFAVFATANVGRSVAVSLDGEVLTVVTLLPFAGRVIFISPLRTIEAAQSVTQKLGGKDLSVPKQRPPSNPIELSEGGWTLWRLGEMAIEFGGPGAGRALLRCTQSSLFLTVRSVVPAQSFPQPKLTMRIGGDEWTLIPDARSHGGKESSLEAEFYMNENVMRDRSTMAAIAAGGVVRIEFNEQKVETTPIPKDYGGRFSQYCLGMWQLP
jgi:hypothetical protein